ncbi:hypothetical protein MIR68_001497 [Amoeboaphelidium protococcarum]|nr:hypothetical protein MIR68_001497 [Amoeboaphelidium protococcarum]
MEYNQVAAKSSSVLTSEEEYDEELDLYRNKLLLAVKASSEQQTPQAKINLKNTKAKKPVKVKQNEPQEDTAEEGDDDTQSQISASQESVNLNIKSDSRQSSQSAAKKSKKRKNISSEYIYDSDDEELDSRLRNQDLRKSGKRTIVTHLKKSGFHKVLRLSEHLQKIVGSDTASRVEVVKALHVYVKANNLQDPNDGRYILCDENIKAICKVKRISMFKINAHFSKHLFDLDDLNATVTEDDDDDGDHDDTDKEDMDSVDNDASSVASSISSMTSGDYAVDKFERIKRRRSKKSTSSNNNNNKKRRKPAVKLGATTPKRFKAKLLSPQLQAIVQKERLSNFDVNKHLWAYIKEHKLQDPKDGRYILCDDKLKALFKSNRVNGFSMQKVVTKHIWDAQDESSTTLPPIAENQ